MKLAHEMYALLFVSLVKHNLLFGFGIVQLL